MTIPVDIQKITLGKDQPNRLHGLLIVIYPDAGVFREGKYKKMSFGISCDGSGEILTKLETEETLDQVNAETKNSLLVQGVGVAEHPLSVVANGKKWVITQKCYCGDLSDRFSSRPLDDAARTRISLDLLTGLERIHSKGLIHRDIKPENIMTYWDEKNQERAAITDFGMTIAGGTRRGYSGTPYYISPEGWKFGTGYGRKIDVWAMGLTLLELWSGQSPFYLNIQKEIEKISSFKDVDKIFGTSCEKIQPVVAERLSEKSRILLYPDGLNILICGMLHPDYKLRWTSAEALKAFREITEKAGS